MKFCVYQYLTKDAYCEKLLLVCFKICCHFCLYLSKTMFLSKNIVIIYYIVEKKIFVSGMGPNYLNEVFQWAAESNRTLRHNYLKLTHSFCKTTAGQLSFLGPSKWNKRIYRKV